MYRILSCLGFASEIHPQKKLQEIARGELIPQVKINAKPSNKRTLFDVQFIKNKSGLFCRFYLSSLTQLLPKHCSRLTRTAVNIYWKCQGWAEIDYR